MSLLYCDSFDAYGTAQIGDSYASLTGTSIAIASSAGRNGTNGLLLTGGGLATHLTRAVPASATLIVGFAFKSAITGTCILSFVDGASSQFEVTIQTTTGYLEAKRNSTLLATATTGALVSTNTYYIEVKVTFHDTAGAYEIRVNGVTVLSATGVNTRTSVNNSANGVRLGSPYGNSLTANYDDLYICDALGTRNNNFLGDCRVEALIPQAEGFYSAWTPSAGVDNSALVDEVPPNEDVDFVSSNTIGQKDTYVVSDMATVTGTVYGVQTRIRARKDDPGARIIRPLVRRAAVDAEGADAALSTAYTPYIQVFETDPTDSTDWTIAKVNAAEVGVKLQS